MAEPEHEDGRMIARFAVAGGAEIGAYAALYERWRAPIYSYLRGLLRDPGLAEDATQETFIRAGKAAKRFDPAAGSFERWIHSIARNHAIDLARRAARLRIVPTDAPELSRLLDAEHARRPAEPESLADSVLAALIAELTPAQGHALFLRFVLDLSLAEAAEEMGREPDAVRMLQTRGLARLRELLEDGVVGEA